MITHVFNSSIVSGPETLVLPALRNLGEPVSIVFLSETRLGEKSQEPVRYAQSLGLKTYVIPVSGRWDSRAISELYHLLLSLRPDIIHAHDVKASVYVWKSARSGVTASLVSTHHGAAARRGVTRLYEEFYVRFVLPRFAAALCVCQWDRHSLEKRSVPRSILHVHHNGVDRPSIRPDERLRVQMEIREKWRSRCPSLPSQSDNFLWIGAVARLSWEKRHDRMLAALLALRTIKPDFRVVLLCFGRGPEEERLRKLTHQAGLDNHVHWMGYDPSIGREIAGFDLLLCLSDGEGIPINLLEAGWSATPVLATSVGGIPDLIPGEQFGYLIDRNTSDLEIGCHLLAILSDKSQLRLTGRRFQERVTTHFSESAWLQQLRSIYEMARQTRSRPQ